jgi:hypothetical protein
MDQILCLQYRRRGKRLQIIVLPYSFNVSAAALIRFVSAYDENIDPIKGWRMWPITGMATTLKINELPDFEADIAVTEIFKSQWMDPERVRLESKGHANTESWDMGDLVGGRVPRQLLTRIHEQVDNWA